MYSIYIEYVYYYIEFGFIQIHYFTRSTFMNTGDLYLHVIFIYEQQLNHIITYIHAYDLYKHINGGISKYILLCTHYFWLSKFSGNWHLEPRYGYYL